MKNWQLTLLAAAAALSLQACEVNVRSSAPQDSAATSQPAAATAEAPSPAPADTSANTASTVAATGPTGTPTDASSASPVASADTSTPAATPVSPDATAMGAASPVPAAAPFAAPAAASDGVAAPTELARFLEQNPPGAKQQDTAASKSDAGKSDVKKVQARQDSKGSKS
jgi:predicted component of type VI protein secretion system